MPFKSEAQRRKFYAMKSRGEISASTVKHWEDVTPKDKKLPEHVKHAEIFQRSLEKSASLTKQSGGVFSGIDYLEGLPKGKRLITMGKDYLSLLGGKKSSSLAEQSVKRIMKGDKELRALRGAQRNVATGYVKDVVHGKKPVSMEWGNPSSLKLEADLWGARHGVASAKSQERIARLATAGLVTVPTYYGVKKYAAKSRQEKGLVSTVAPPAAAAVFGTAPILQGLKSKALSLSTQEEKAVKQYKNVRQAERALRPGDVLLTSSPGKSGYFKGMISALGGDPYGYHTTTMTGIPRRKDKYKAYIHSSPGEGGAAEYLAALGKDEDVTIRRFKNKSLAKKYVQNLKNLARAEEPLENIFGESARGTMYDTPRAVRGAVRSFLPGPVAKLVGKGGPTSPGGTVCSSLVGMASPKCLVPGVDPADLLPHHIRRSGVLKTVGAYHAPRTARQLFYEKSLAAAPWAIRGLAGLGLGYGAYRGAKALTDKA